MKAISNKLCCSTSLIFLSVSLLFNQAYAYSGGCNNLHVVINDSVFQKYETLFKRPRIFKGTYNGCLKVYKGTENCTDYLFDQSAFSYGPEIEIEFNERGSNKTAKIRIQQNYCFMEAGNITVTAEKGKFKYTKLVGNFFSIEPGVVTITSIEAQ
ncbi:MAG: hypothetical protein LPD71_02820 [Shewanella sp.]|nr:hypothetical protein [Shewanella sp.]MCF1431838.1 hypothetical protein [Shewanella sp.]MCF1437706.1 hypothetical protein [Shewanella sp.]MCF1456780.1 hypothetical protein [Shewanella sp.]